MTVLLYSHPACLLHDGGLGHPERPDRIGAALAGVRASGLQVVERDAPPAPVEALYAVHQPEYVESIEVACALGGRQLDPDTAVVAESWEAALRAAGSGLAAIDDLSRGDGDTAFLAVRPPGHHAERDLAMGFCLFNNVAVAARALQRRHGIGRVLVADWDVHHGNGTQHIFEDDPSVFYFSCHQSPLYPGTGAASEQGRGEGLGTTLNRPLDPGSGDAEFLEAIDDGLRQAAESFEPDFVLLSAGFDAHRSDPLAQLEVSTEAYGKATRVVREIADRHAEGRLVSVLEGGYDLDALSEAVSTHLAELLRED